MARLRPEVENPQHDNVTTRLPLRWLVIALGAGAVAAVTYVDQPAGIAASAFIVVAHQLHEMTA